ALNGFKFSWLIGEFIIINFAGPKMLNGNYCTQILFSGKACREFEYNYKGSFFDLFNFLISKHNELGYTPIDSIIFDSTVKNSNGFENTGEAEEGKYFNGNFKRIDIAIDDFTGKEQNIYNLKYYAENHWWIGSFTSCRVIESSIKKSSRNPKGYSLTFGSRGSNQLVIYDKYLEQLSNGDPSNTPINPWYRYEMRFVNDKARRVIGLLLTYKDSNKLNKIILSLLNTCIEFKSPNKKIDNPSRQYIRSQPTLESWKKFTEYTEKIDLNNHLAPDMSVQKKLKWINFSLPTTFTQLYLIHKDDPDIFEKAFLNYANKGAFKMKQKQFVAINKYLKRTGKNELTKDEIIRIKSYGIFHKDGK
ncbi:MAG: replication initiation factor domain-containing protein, partial [Candidatus Izimaplasma sp.]|nr:replication initiation factor domain-containing protein [Candidatus Izimaplasma bacterium]